MSFQDQKRLLWVNEGLQPGVYDSWPKATLQVNGISRSFYKKFVKFSDIVDSFTGYYIWSVAKVNDRLSVNMTPSQMKRVTG